MKKYFLVFVVIIFLSNCNQKEKAITNDNFSSTKELIHTFLDNWHKAASEANYENYFGKMDSISIFIGTDATENWTKSDFEAYSKPHFDKGKAWNFKVLERNLYLNKTENFAWFDENLDTKRGTFRGSGVLEKIGNDWKIKHYVLSVPIPNEDMSEVIKITNKNDSIFRSRFK